MIKRENYLKRIRKLMNKEIIKVITGIRRSGKTYLLKSIIQELQKQQIPDENIIYISLDWPKYKHIKNDEQLDEIILNLTKNLSGKIYLLFDEIQEVKNWEKSINSYFAGLNSDIYITGSNSKLLSGELATYIAGRYIEIKIYPFSYNELIKYYKEELNTEINPYMEQKIFDEYIHYGGFPFIYQIDPTERVNYLDSIYNTILIKDIISKNAIREPELLERLLMFLIDNIGQPFSVNSIIKFLKHEKRNISHELISNYIKHALRAFIIYKVQREDLKGKKYLKISEKYYLADHGFINMLVENPREKEDQILENIVYIELLRRGFKVTVGKLNKLEIDFVAKKEDLKIYIQVSKSIMDEKTFDREYKPLSMIKDNYPKYIITLDTRNYSQEGIKHLNMIEFLKE